MEMYKKFKKAIDQAQNIVISTHLFPDADGIGSEISLCLALNKFGKNAICCNQERLLERYKYLDPQDLVIGLEDLEERYPQKPDLVIVVDTNTVYRTGERFREYVEEQGCPVFYIDHHPCAESLQDDNCIDTTAAATGQLVGELIKLLGIKFDQEIALPLYTAILIDTSSFRYPTVTAQTHRLIADLMDTGIEPPLAYNGIYGTKKIEHMHLLGNVLASADCNKSEEIAWLVLKREEMEKFNIDIEDTHAFINHLLILDNIKVACMFRDEGKQLKVSLRSTGVVDVGLIAVQLGGGGHSHSAATLINKSDDKSLEEIIKATVERIENCLSNV
ncbi:MAG: bifunctional oligoribonuclease/PAP phosphatase NrnA [Bacteriovoracaceae bacterium]|nr:bifunctional oligoribonuclease/PAP phosphatase NrnA [Bacteriovoracaceae bacterium]